MAAATYDIPHDATAAPLEQGARYELRFTVPYDVTGSTWRGQLRDGYGGDLLATFVFTVESATADSSTIVAAIGAVASARIPSTRKDGVLVKRWPYTIERVPPAGEDYAERVLEGLVAVSPEAAVDAD